MGEAGVQHALTRHGTLLVLCMPEPAPFCQSCRHGAGGVADHAQPSLMLQVQPALPASKPRQLWPSLWTLWVTPTEGPYFRALCTRQARAMTCAARCRRSCLTIALVRMPCQQPYVRNSGAAGQADALKGWKAVLGTRACEALLSHCHECHHQHNMRASLAGMQTGVLVHVAAHSSA